MQRLEAGLTLSFILRLYHFPVLSVGVIGGVRVGRSMGGGEGGGQGRGQTASSASTLLVIV